MLLNVILYNVVYNNESGGWPHGAAWKAATPFCGVQKYALIECLLASRIWHPSTAPLSMKTGNKMFEHFPHICMSVAPIMAIPFHVLWVFNFSFLPVELPKEWAVKNTQMGAIANGDHVLRAFCSHLPALLVQTHRVFFDNFIPILRSKKNRWLSIHRKPQKYSNKVKQLLPIFKENMYRIFNYILFFIWKRNVLNEI